MRIVTEHVKQTALVGVGCRRVGKFKSGINAGHQGGPVQVQGIKSSCLDERFHRALVQSAAVHPNTEIKQTGERTALFPGGHDRFNGLLTRAFDST